MEKFIILSVVERLSIKDETLTEYFSVIHDISFLKLRLVALFCKQQSFLSFYITKNSKLSNFEF